MPGGAKRENAPEREGVVAAVVVAAEAGRLAPAAAEAYALPLFLFPIFRFLVERVQRSFDANKEVASSDDVGLVLLSDGFGRGLEKQIYFFSCGKEVPPQNLPRVTRGETISTGESKGRSRRRPFAPHPRSGFNSRTSAIVKTINVGGPHKTGRWSTSLHGWHVWPELDGIYVPCLPQ